MNSGIGTGIDPARGASRSAFSPRPRAVAGRALGAALVLVGAIFCAADVRAEPLDQFPLTRWAKLREAERYQLQIAEKYYREQNWKVALTEYEKFLSLYEKSDGAPYAQMKWSQCQVQLRKLNTAIKEGFQSVVDYWPDSPEGIACSYFIAKTYKEMGETKKAKQAYQSVLAKHKNHVVAVLARVDLIDQARIEGDQTRRIALLKELTFEAPRNPDTTPACVTASQQLAVHSFIAGNFAEGQKALATTYPPEQMPYHLWYFAQTPIGELTAKPETKEKGEKLADAAVAFIREQVPADLTDPAKKAIARQYWFHIADLNSVARRVEKIPEIYQQIEKLFGSDDEILGRLAAWHKTQSQRDAARTIYARFQNPAEGQGQIAWSFREEQKYEPAIAIYRTLSLQDPKQIAKWKGELALTYRHAAKCDEAVGVYRELLNEDAAQGSRWQWEIGCTYRDFGRYKEAISTFRQSDNVTEAYKQMAGCHRQLKEFKEAVGLYYQVLGSHPPSAPWALLQVGYTQEQAGDKEKAIKALQQVCAKFPKTGEASEAHAYLQTKFMINATLGGAKTED
jgi:tetratricopeptide (TPR) repeat protein